MYINICGIFYAAGEDGRRGIRNRNHRFLPVRQKKFAVPIPLYIIICGICVQLGGNEAAAAVAAAAEATGAVGVAAAAVEGAELRAVAQPVAAAVSSPAFFLMGRGSGKLFSSALTSFLRGGEGGGK
jgi:hypothetical protein